MLSLDVAARNALMRLTGPPRIAWTLAQSGSHVTGTVSVTVQGVQMLTGTLNGTYINGALTYIVSVPAGAVSIAPGCAGTIDGLATVTATELSGNASVRSSTCGTPVSTINFTLMKQ